MSDTKPCHNPDCRSGKIQKFDFRAGTKHWETCTTCGGTGFLADKDAKKEGLYVERVPGMPFWVEWYEDDLLLSWAKIRACPAMLNNKRHIVIEIDHIETKKSHRRKGLATNIVQQLMSMFEGEVKYIITNWSDSTDASKQLLMKQGFARDGKALVWKRDG